MGATSWLIGGKHPTYFYDLFEAFQHVSTIQAIRLVVQDLANFPQDGITSNPLGAYSTMHARWCPIVS